jgi:hypothetical protein
MYNKSSSSFTGCKLRGKALIDRHIGPDAWPRFWFVALWRGLQFASPAVSYGLLSPVYGSLWYFAPLFLAHSASASILRTGLAFPLDPCPLGKTTYCWVVCVQSLREEIGQDLVRLWIANPDARAQCCVFPTYLTLWMQKKKELVKMNLSLSYFLNQKFKFT